jgi:hypothetical protein
VSRSTASYKPEPDPVQSFPSHVIGDQQAHRSRRGSKGGRPASYDRDLYKRRNVVEAPFALLKQPAWAGHATTRTP